MWVNLEPGDYYTQRNNKVIRDAETGYTVNPWDACMPTARVMFYLGNKLKFTKSPTEPDDEAFTKLLLTPKAVAFRDSKYPWAREYPPNEIHGMYPSYLDPLVLGKRRSDFAQDLGFDDVVDRIKRGQVIMTSGRFQGQTGIINGHAVCLVGFDGQRLLLADPYGDFRTKYATKNGYLVSMTRNEYETHIKPLGPQNGMSLKKWGHIPL